MKRLLIFLLFSCSTVLFAQNWSPILVNEKMNYQHSDSSYISHTIWVDSANYSGYDSIFYLNRVVKDVPGNPEIVLRNQPQFLMELMVRQNYGIYSFHYPFNYSISTGLPLGATWLFDLTNIIDAEITACYEEEIFGVLDSAKMISLSDGNEIRLSKNFGIIKFPDFENGGYFELVGIQDSDYGESVPGFWKIFDFEVGDVFQYHYSFEWGYGNDYFTRKYTITEKDITNTGYIYLIEGIASGTSSGATIIYYINEVNSYSLESHIVTNLSNNNLVSIYESNCPYWDNVHYSIVSCYSDTNGLVNKNWGLNFNQSEGDLYYRLNEVSDTLIMMPNDEVEYCMDNPDGLTYTESLGITFDYIYFIDCRILNQLEGYIKNGDTVGVITSDSILLVGIGDNKSSTDYFSVYPNPATEWLSIKQSNPNYTYYFELRNLYGQMVKEEKNIQSSQLYHEYCRFKSPGYIFM